MPLGSVVLFTYCSAVRSLAALSMINSPGGCPVYVPPTSIEIRVLRSRYMTAIISESGTPDSHVRLAFSSPDGHMSTYGLMCTALGEVTVPKHVMLSTYSIDSTDPP